MIKNIDAEIEKIKSQPAPEAKPEAPTPPAPPAPPTQQQDVDDIMNTLLSGSSQAPPSESKDETEDEEPGEYDELPFFASKDSLSLQKVDIKIGRAHV